MDRTPLDRNTAWAVGHSDYLQSHAPNDPRSSPQAPTTRLRPLGPTPRARRLASTQEKDRYLSSRATVPICHVSSRTCLGLG